MNLSRLRQRMGLTAYLFSISLFCVFLYLARYYATGKTDYLFLNWNLFLAIIPWIITSNIRLKEGGKTNWFVLVITIGTWLLFFPNAPYILTDLYHLKFNHSAPIWFDHVLIISFAWTGLIFGFLSLMDIESLLSRWMKPWLLKSCVAILLFISAFGIYLGRFLRWNSWDLINKPFNLLYDA